MKKQIYLVTIIMVMLFLSSCGPSRNQLGFELPSSEDFWCKYRESNGPILDVDDSVKLKLAHAVECIVNNDAQGFASSCDYPIVMKAPIHCIEDSAQMVAMFGIFFDEASREFFKGASYQNWSQIGWRGMICANGLFWDTSMNGKINVINYKSSSFLKYKSGKIVEEMSTLHSSLQGKWEPECSFKCKDGTVVRIDHDSIPIPQEFHGLFRMSIFFKGTPLNAKPDVCMNGLLDIQGSANVEVFSFKNEDYDAEFIYYNDGSFTLNGPKKIDEDKIHLSYWDELIARS